MSDRAFDSDPEAPLLSGPVGDVRLARLAARALLARGALEPDGVLARMFLTAALLHCAVHGGGETRRRDVANYLEGVLNSGTPGPGMLRSPVQFLRYAGEEVGDLAPQSRCRLIASLLSLVSGGGYLEDCGGDKEGITTQNGPRSVK